MGNGKQGCGCDDAKNSCCEVRGGACCSDDGNVTAMSKDELLAAKTSLEKRLKEIDDAMTNGK